MNQMPAQHKTPPAPSSLLEECLPWFAALALMAALPSLLPMAFGRTAADIPEASDIGNQGIAFARFVGSSWRIGHFPLWDPHDLCGMPFLAFAHTGALYPPNVLLHVIVSRYHVAAGLDIFAHLSLAAWTSFFLFRSLGGSSHSSFIGAVAYAFAGYVFANINFPPTLHSAAWLPLLFASAIALARGGGFSWALILALSLSACALGGDAEATVYALLAAGFEIALMSRDRRAVLRAVPAIICGLALGALIASALALPALELARLSVRGSADFLPAIDLRPMLLAPALTAFHVPTPTSLFPPNGGLSPWYLGAVPVLLVAGAIAGGGRPAKRLLFVPFVIALIALIYLPPLNLAGRHIPVLGKMVVPLRAWPAIELMLLMSALQFLDRWSAEESRAPLPLGKWGAAWLIVAAAAAALSLLFLKLSVPARMSFALAAACAGALALLRPGHRLFGSQNAPRLLAAIVVLDLYVHAAAMSPSNDPGILDPDPRAEALLADTGGRFRYAILSIDGILDRKLPFHLGLRLNADSIDTHIRMPPHNAAKRLARLYPATLPVEDGRLRRYDQLALRSPDNVGRDSMGLWARMNVEYLVARQRLPWLPAEMKVFREWDHLVIYRNEAAMPRFFAREGGATIEVPFKRIAPDHYRLSIPGTYERAIAARGGVEIESSESYYPGWRARGAGGEIKLRADELAFTSLEVSDAGDIDLVYRPWSFRAGLWASAVSLLALSAAFLRFLIIRSFNPR